MRCPFCSVPESKVIDSRPSDNGSSIRRRRECVSCGKKFTTYEDFFKDFETDDEEDLFEDVVDTKAENEEITTEEVTNNNSSNDDDDDFKIDDDAEFEKFLEALRKRNNSNFDDENN